MVLLTALCVLCSLALRQRRRARRRARPRRARPSPPPCVACHGVERQQRESGMAEPRRSARARTSRKQLQAFKSGARQNPLMTPMAMGAVGRRHGRPRRVLRRAEADGPGSRPGKVALGQRLYRGGDPKNGVAGLRRVSRPGGDGNPPAALSRRIRGQHATYVAAQLKAYRAGTRQTDPNQMMRNVAQHDDRRADRRGRRVRPRPALNRHSSAPSRSSHEQADHRCVVRRSLSLATAACGKQEQPAAPAAAGCRRNPRRHQPPGGEPAATAAAATPAATEEAAPTAPTETISETDDAPGIRRSSPRRRAAVAAAGRPGDERAGHVRTLQGRHELPEDRARAAHERRARQGRSRRSVLVRLRSLLRARSGDRVVAQQGQASRTSSSCAFRRCGTTRCACTRACSTPPKLLGKLDAAALADLSRDPRRRQSAEHRRQDHCVLQASTASARRNSRRRSHRSRWNRSCSARTSSIAATASSPCRRWSSTASTRTDVGMAGGEPQLFQLIDELAAHEHGG